MVIKKLNAETPRQCAMNILQQKCDNDITCAFLSKHARMNCELCISQNYYLHNIYQLWFQPFDSGYSSCKFDTGYVHGIFNGSAYEAGFTKMTMQEAKSICEVDGGHLVYIETQDELTALQNYAQNNWEQFGDGVWTGAETDGQNFYWPNGQIDNSMWGEGQPSLTPAEECILAYTSGPNTPFLLGDAPCWRLLYYLCERN